MARRTLIILLLVFAVSYMDRQLVGILIEPIKRELGLTDTAAGLLYGFAFAVFFSVLGIPIARHADRSNRSRIITISVLLFSAMTALCGWASTFWQLILARIGVGIGEAGTGPASHSIIADLYPVEKRGAAMAIFATGVHLGVLLGFLVGGYLGQTLGWRYAFFIAGGLGLMIAAAGAVLLHEPARMLVNKREAQADPVSLAHAVQAVWRCPSMRHVFAGGTIMNIAVNALMAWLAAFLIRSHGLSLTAIGLLLASVIGILGAGGTLLGGFLADRLGQRDAAWRLRCIVIAFVVSIPCWTIVIAVDSRWIALPALLLGGALMAFNVGPSFAIVQTLARPDARALTASLLIFIANLVGVGVGPLVVGLLSDAAFETYGNESLRVALLIVPCLYVWAAVHYELASRTLVSDLRIRDMAAAAKSQQEAPETTRVAAGI